MPNYANYREVIKLLSEAQDTDEDNRSLAKEDHIFLAKEDGQWEQHIIDSFDTKPRYTFDQTTPIVDQIAGDMEKSNFDISIKPTGAGATKELAEVRSGMTRNIENISEAQGIYAMAGRNMVTAGLDHWMVATEFLDDTSFDQDLIIKPIHNSIDRVWFDVGAQRQDKADANHGWLLSAIPRSDFLEKNPKRSGKSVDDGSESETYYNKNETVVIGHLFFRKTKSRELIKTTLGRVFFKDDEKFIKIQDELAQAGETIDDTRMVKVSTFFMRKFDGDGWMGKAEETVFSSIPLVPIYGNYQVIENKMLYRGVVRKLKDPQRVLNYSQSREIEEGALAPRAKKWMTKAQAKGHSNSLRTMNTNTDPVQFYNHVEGELPPFDMGGAQINPGLSRITESMKGLMGSTAGIFAVGMGDNPFNQSGIAIERLQNKTNNITVKYFSPVEVGVCRTATIINEAYPKVYDTERQQRILNVDGSFEMQMINQAVIDQETGDEVILNDMSIGKYTASCKAGPSFASQQDETVQSILKVAAVDPSILLIGQDIFLSNINAPGLDKVAERSRQQLLKTGVIPESQQTDEEKQQIALAAQQPQAPDANMVLAQAEQAKADAQAAKVQVDQQRNQIEMVKAQNKINLDMQNLQLAARKLELDAQQRNVEFQEKLAKLNQATQKQEFDQLIVLQDQQNQFTNDAINNLNTQANTLKTLADAIATSPIQGPGNAISYIQQTQEVIGSQTVTQ